jgi:hypothetical protein
MYVSCSSTAAKVGMGMNYNDEYWIGELTDLRIDGLKTQSARALRVDSFRS